ncbi:Protein of unknown function [Haladaptatus paucihalophilus DX253]|uniref:DUF3592 domain-containing protein n=1 Tax=Haladaptatus paucihalophilus DX253 TaxID=797209 RepID=A0A1M6T6H3_HALPU|nr:Protein of unknown function [Haladaptatus paucihalophilus DX253]
MPSNRSRRVLAFVLALALIGYGGNSLYSQHRKITTYETTDGTVVSTAVHSERTGKPSIFGDSKSYYPTIDYRYSVAGTTYRNDNVYSSSKIPGGERPEATALVNRYAEGKRVTVHYAADDPSKSFLSGNYTFFPAYLVLLAGLVLLRDSLNPGSVWVRKLLPNRDTGRQKGSESILTDPPSLDADEWDDDWPTRRSDSTAADVNAHTDTPITDDRHLLALSAGFYVAVVAVFAHYFLVSGRPYSSVAYVSLLVGAVAFAFELRSDF